jgi:uncharacterized membrane protein
MYVSESTILRVTIGSVFQVFYAYISLLGYVKLRKEEGYSAPKQKLTTHNLSYRYMIDYVYNYTPER